MARSKVAQHLERLQTADLIRLVQTHPDLEYWFKHAVIQEAVYGSLLKASRVDLHRRVAATIERTLPADAADRAAVLAMHYERAGLYERAFDYAVAAGDEALRTYALQEAVGFYDRALAMVERQALPVAARAIHAVYASRGRAYQSRGDHPAAVENFRAMLRAASATGDPGLKADALNYLTTLQILAEVPLDELEANLAEALTLARAANDPLLVGRALWNIGLAYRFYDPERSEGYLKQALDLTRGLDDADVRIRELQGYVLNDLGVVYFALGKFAPARRYVNEALGIFRALDHRPMLADLLGSLGSLEYVAGNPNAARAAISEGRAISVAIGNQWTLAYSNLNLADVEADAGNFERVLELVEEALKISSEVVFPPFLWMAYQSLTIAYAELGRPDLLDSHAREMDTGDLPESAPSLWRAMNVVRTGRLALARGDLETAWSRLSLLALDYEGRTKDLQAVYLGIGPLIQTALLLGRTEGLKRFLDWGLSFLGESGVDRFAGEILYWRGRVRAAENDLAGAIEDFERARVLLASAGAVTLLWSVEAAVAEAYRATGDARRAGEAHESAVATIERIAAGIANPDYRRSFLARPDVARALGKPGIRPPVLPKAGRGQ